MLNQLLPRTVDNTYRGYKIALWLFGLVVALRGVQSVMIIFNGRSVAVSADGIPLDTFPPAAAQTVLALFALYSLARLIISLLGALALVRYRSAIPFMFAVLLLHLLANELLLRLIPMFRVGSPPGPYVNFVMTALAAVGFALSLLRRNELQARE